MDPIGYVVRITEATSAIDFGRKGFSTRGMEQEGRISYEKGIAEALSAFHIACISHKTRIQNMLRTPGLDQIEKSLLKQRFINLSAAQNGYIEKQRKALAN